jgi:RecB family exonuclease
MTASIPNWAFSTLMKYESCPHQVKLAKIDKCPEPPRDPKTDPLARGNREHKMYEHYVKGKLLDLSGSVARAIADFIPRFKEARALYDAGLATTEENWFFDKDWMLCKREDMWLWLKIDLCVQDKERKRVVVVDYKTGKSTYKTVEHVQQLQLYAACAALKFEWADEIVCELWYVDEGWVRTTVYTRTAALFYVRKFDDRAIRLMSEKFWRPNPTRQTCKWCPFSPRGTGACAAGV